MRRGATRIFKIENERVGARFMALGELFLVVAGHEQK